MSELCPEVPYRTEIKGGRRYLWCSCGLSARQPFCDYSHVGKSDREPVEFSLPETLTVALCGCKRTSVPPYCDGAHAACGRETVVADAADGEQDPTGA